MGIFYRASNGVETPLAGLAPAGQLVPSVSLYQSGSIEITTIPGQAVYKTISLPISMPDLDYCIDVQAVSGFPEYCILNAMHTSTNSFRIYAYNTGTANYAQTVTWRAFKLMTNEDRALDEERIATNTKNFAPNFSATTSYAIGDYCIYQGVLYRCTTAHTAGDWVAGHFTQATVGKTLSDIVPNTANSSNKLVDKATLNKINITHQSAGEAQQYANTWTELAIMPIGSSTYARNSIAISLICCYGGNTKNGILYCNANKENTVTALAHYSLAVSGGLVATDFGADVVYNGNSANIIIRCKAPANYDYYHCKVLDYLYEPTLLSTVERPTVAPTFITPNDVVKI